MKLTNKRILIVGDIAYVDLTQGQVALIDADDVDLVSNKSWRADKRSKGRGFYAATTVVNPCGTRKTLRMHCLILRSHLGLEVDHINTDGLDNRKENLRLATRNQNEHNKSKYKNNTSGFKGVTWDKSNKKWVAQITVNGKRIGLGYYNTAQNAHDAYSNASKELHKDFSRAL